MKKSRALALLALFGSVWVLSACIVVVEKEEDDYHRRRWRLEVIVYDNHTYYNTQSSGYTVTLNEASFTGTGDCNQFEGQYKTDVAEGDFQVLALSNTEKGCGVESLEPLFFSGLRTSHTYEVNGDEMVLQYNGRGNQMQFTAVD